MIVLTTSGGDVAMRVHHGDADRIIDIIMRLQRGEVVAPAAPAPPTGPGFLGQQPRTSWPTAFAKPPTISQLNPP